MAAVFVRKDPKNGVGDLADDYALDREHFGRRVAGLIPFAPFAVQK